jgi:hypothetical protein
MSKFVRLGPAVLTVFALASFAQSPSQTFGPLKPNPEWTIADGVYTHGDAPAAAALETRQHLGDTVTSFEFRAPRGTRAVVHVQGRYAVELEGNGEWQPVFLSFRAPRFDAGYTKQQHAFAPEVRVGTQTRRNVLFKAPSAGARWDSEDRGGPTLITVSGRFELRNVRYELADFEALTPPAASGAATNERELVDLVSAGREVFESVGCGACHLVAKDAAGVTSGPNLFGLFRRDARDREVVEGEGHRFRVKAGRDYLHRSLRDPAGQLAVAESGPTLGEPYPPAMPAFPRETLSDWQIDTIGAYLATLNEVYDRGPAVRLASRSEPAQAYDPLADRLQFLVGDEVRLQRGPLAGVSGRSIHVGNPNSVHYTFDPRLLAVVKVWQGGFLDMTGELTNRGGRGLALGHESRDVSFGAREYLLAPLDPAGKPIDFTFKEAKFGDFETLKTLLARPEDHLAQLAAVDAAFLGYTRDSRSKTAAPSFRYRVGRNTVEVATAIAADGTVTIDVGGKLPAGQQFALNAQLLQAARADAGTLAGERWSLPAGTRRARLTGRVALGAQAWRPAPSNYSHERAPLVTAPAKAQLPAGYSIESWYPPKDNYGREQLFEALGLAVAKDGTVVVGTRTAGIWRVVKGEWRLFAEGLFDSLGVVVEDGKGLVVVAGQKAELTRISDTNGDGIADRYDTLFDAHSYHGNYHTYLHGPARAADGSYYFALNLAHDGTNTTYNAGGAYMGTWGGLSGWAVRVKPGGGFELFAHGLRSPASIGAGPDGRVWYADNQGEYVGTSKMFELERDQYYGHPSALVDLPGMTPASPEIRWDKWMDRRARAVILFPHNRVANSPGNPAWVPAGSSAGPFAGQMLVGDQTQSNLLRVALQEVDGVEQGSVMPFFEGLESGVMRPVFLRDGSLLLGQTGRGWQARGGKVASLQHVRWDRKTVAPAIVAMVATRTGFRLDLTQPLGSGITDSALGAATKLESWVYRDAPDYGSPELDLRNEAAALRIGTDRKSIHFDLTSLEQPKVHPHQTARVYHVRLASAALFDAHAPAELHAYYSLYAFPAK